MGLAKRNMQVDIILTENFKDKEVKLRQLDADDAHKMLGIYTEPAEKYGSGQRYAQEKQRLEHQNVWF